MVRKQLTLSVATALAISALFATQAGAASEAYIQQSRGRVSPTAIRKPTPETSAPAAAAQPTAAPTAPETCNAQNASSSQACYTATQQARPGTR